MKTVSGPTDRAFAPVIFLLTGGYAAFAVKRAALALPGQGPPEANKKTKTPRKKQSPHNITHQNAITRCPPQKVTLITPVIRQQRAASQQTHQGGSIGAGRAAENRPAHQTKKLAARPAVSWKRPSYPPNNKNQSYQANHAAPPQKVTLITPVIRQQRAASRQTHQGGSKGAGRAAENRQPPSNQ